LINGFQTFFTSRDVSTHTESLQPRDDSSSSSEDEDSQAPVYQLRQLQWHQNRQRQQLHQLLTNAAKCASWRHVLASHWCRADMRGSVNLVLCACQLWMDAGCPVCRADITMVISIFFLISHIMPKYNGDIQPNYCYFCAVSLLCFIKNIKHVYGIQ